MADANARGSATKRFGLGSATPPDLPETCCDLDAHDIIVGAKLDLRSACTATEDQACCIVRHLSAWNELLWEVRLELRQLSGTRGRLAVASVEGARFLNPADAQAQKIASLVYWLLKTHRCVEAVDIRLCSLRAHDNLVVEAIQGNCVVRTLKLGFSFRSGRTHKVFGTAVASLGNLQELECNTVGQCSAEFSTALCALLRSNTSLSVLRIPELEMKKEEAQTLLTGLAANVTLKELSLHESAISEASASHRCTFATKLSNGAVLNTLCVRGFAQMRRDVFRWVLDCLQKSKTITKVTLPNVVVNEDTGPIITQIFTRNAVLRSFNMTGIRSGHNVQPEPLFDPWHQALLNNQTLEEFTLPFNVWSPEQWTHFLSILSTKVSIRKITIELSLQDFQHLPEVYETLARGGAGEKVFFRSWVACCVLDSLVWKECSQCYAWLRSSTQPIFRRILQQLPLFAHVTSVHIDIWMPLLDEETSSIISTCIEKSQSLRKLHLVCTRGDINAPAGTNRCWASVVESLSLNRSIRELRISAECVEEEDIERLAGVIKSSPNIHTVHYISERRCHTNAFFRVMCEDAAANYTVLNIDLRGYVDKQAAKDFFELRNTARRNCSLVTRGAEFVAGVRCDRYCAQALERVCRHVALPEKVADLASVSEAEAATMVRESLRSFQGMHDFMRLAGVVKERVTCEAGSVRLDSLNEHCWGRVRRYLLLEYIGAPKA